MARIDSTDKVTKTAIAPMVAPFKTVKKLINNAKIIRLAKRPIFINTSFFTCLCCNSVAAKICSITIIKGKTDKIFKATKVS